MKEAMATKEELEATKQELRAAREELRAAREELQAAKEELEAANAAPEIYQEVYDLVQDGICCLIDRAVDNVRDDMNEQLKETRELCKGLKQAIDELDVYTTDEVEERLSELQRHCEGLNELETEEMVLGAKSDLENDVREEIRDAKSDFQMWLRKCMRLKLAKVVEDKVRAAKLRVMDAVRVEMRRTVWRRRHCRHGHGPLAFESNKKFRRRLRTAWSKEMEIMRRVEAAREASTASTGSTDQNSSDQI